MLIGISAVMLMVFNGRIAGISGILGRLFPPYDGADPSGAAAFVIGLLAAPRDLILVVRHRSLVLADLAPA